MLNFAKRSQSKSGEASVNYVIMSPLARIGTLILKFDCRSALLSVNSTTGIMTIVEGLGSRYRRVQLTDYSIDMHCKDPR